MLNDDNPGWGRIPTCVAAQLLDSEVFTVLKVLLMLLPSVVTIEMQATRISASITAYSTAVGPSSLTRNREIDGRMRAIVFQLQEKSGGKAENTALHFRLLPEPDMGDAPTTVKKVLTMLSRITMNQTRSTLLAPSGIPAVFHVFGSSFA